MKNFLIGAQLKSINEDGEELDKNPIITNVEIERYENGWGDIVKVVLFGESKPLYEIDSEASSGTGWQYGACAWIECRLVKMEETLACW